MSSFYERRGKRAVDLIGSSIGLIAFTPILLVVAGLVRWKMGTPILFRQERPGLDGNPFTLVKFRTMTNLPKHEATVPADALRLTVFGAKLRASSMDELPELWNVLRGDMSLVGPRPLLMQYLSRYSTEQARRHHARPGITGLAQVSGRNALTWEEKFSLDVRYVENMSVRLDAQILWRTMATVIRGRGVTAENHATTIEFNPGA